ncbi:hypothetical protein F511_08388 [Dorcoceras hygrometricum]|uniref:Uncharacterized protein n=1 Tax=Dorcoceras hygrometricum TaxID=472368 RepID=A0A2Z7BCJ9_9LAMI|nr:hypothetical protein F511_08388 [Dorcoceras hygrometricum]
MAAAVASIACGAWPHAAAPSVATSRDIVRQGWRAARRSSRNNLRLAAGHCRTLVAEPCAKTVTSRRPPCEKEQQLVGATPRNTCAKQQQLWPAIARRLLRQPALEGLTRSARTDSPKKLAGTNSGEGRRRRRRRVAGTAAAAAWRGGRGGREL